MSTHLSIFLVLAASLGVAFHLLIDRLNARVERQYLEAAEEPMVDIAHILAATVESRIVDSRAVPDPSVLKAAIEGARRRQFQALIYSVLKTSVDMNAYLTNADGIVLFDSSEPSAEGMDYGRMLDVALTLQGKYGARSTRSDEKNDHSSIMFVGAPVRHRSEIVGCLTVSKPQASMFAFMGETRHYIQAMGWLVYLGALAVSALILYWFARPINRLISYARAVRQGGRPTLKRSRNREVAALGDAIEAMRESLEGRQYAETYVQTLTHEMKSPVAAIRGAAELLEDTALPDPQRKKFLANIQIESHRLQNSIERLLALSSIESRNALDKPSSIDLAALTRRVIDDHSAAIEAGSIELDLRLPPPDTPPLIHGDPFIIEMAVSNLLQNALDFSPEGGTITIEIKKNPARPAAFRITLTDSGPGVPDYALSRVFDRFYSLQHPDTGKKSSGLGLCFVKEAANLHHGHATLENHSIRGATATLELPARP